MIPRTILTRARRALLPLTLGARALPLGAATCNVKFGGTKQTIRGFGACTTGWQGGLTATERDKGLTSGGGILGLDIARIEVPATTDRVAS